MITLWFQLRAELWKLFARRRTHLGFAAFIALQIALYFLFRVVGIEKFYEKIITANGQVFDSYFSALTLGLIIMGFSVVLLSSLFMALVSGDIVAKESEDGHMRMLLARPISRVRLLSIKFLSCFIYSVVLTQFAAWAALALGIVVRGWGGGMAALLPEQGILSFFPGDEGFRRYMIGVAILGVGLSVVSALGFMLSCFRIKPAAATIGALAYIIIDTIVRLTKWADGYEFILLTHHIGNWAFVFAEDIPWARIIRSLTVLLAVDLSMFVVGAAVFQNRDLKS
jgi:ABC-2 type transport system permease protein